MPKTMQIYPHETKKTHKTLELLKPKFIYAAGKVFKESWIQDNTDINLDNPIKTVMVSNKPQKFYCGKYSISTELSIPIFYFTHALARVPDDNIANTANELFCDEITGLNTFLDEIIKYLFKK